MNVSDRATDLRTGSVGSPSDESVVFENVWFINCNLAFKSTGGRIVGSPDNPMQVNHCVFAQTPEYPFPSINDIVDIRDTNYINFDHCDFFNHDGLLQQTLDDPEGAPNDGAQVTVSNSIFYATDGEVDDEYDFDIQVGTLTLSNNVYWDAGSESDVQRRGDGTITDENSIVGNPLYTNVGTDVPASELDFSLLTGSPAIAAGNDGLNSGSVAAEPVSVTDWMIK